MTMLVAVSLLALTVACTQAAKRDTAPKSAPAEDANIPVEPIQDSQKTAEPAGDTNTKFPDAETGCVLGDCEGGAGTYRYENGDVYAGAFRKGLREGAGSYKFANGDVLNATFRGGRAAGSGSYLFKDGRIFRGEFADIAGELTGQGLLREGSSSRFCVLRGQTLRCENSTEDANAKKNEPRTSHLLMLFASDSCRVVRNNATIAGGPGVPLFAGDRIESGSEAVELQGRGGIAIRLRPFSVLEIPVGTNDRGGILYLRKGGVAVDYQGDPEKIPFRINARNANFDVEGTTFMVEIDDAKGTAKVRVFEGTVSISPSLPALEKLNLPESEGNSELTENEKERLTDAELQKVAASLMKQTMQVSANQEGELSESAVQKAQELNTAIETTIAERQAAPLSESSTTGADSKGATRLSAATAELERSQVAAPETFEPTPQENAEMQLLITIDEETFEKAVAPTTASGGSGESDEELRARVEKAYDKQLDTRANALQKNLAADQSIRTQADLIKRYKFLEVITFRDGKQKAGSIAAQAGSILIMHAPDGVFRMDRDSIKQIDYYDVVQDESPKAAPEAEAPDGDSLK
ncbi:MAG: FecR domain-containing protein [bacterium]|nr:FecR domain-containing protein [bacterium]